MIDFDNLEKMIAEKYISVQKHPTLDLYIYNYTHRAQFDRVWNNETLQCRGLIMDSNRNIVSRPFRKFFNLGELGPDYQLPAGDFVVTEKMDGSLGISYFDPDGNMFIATRGSFVSDQAIKANEILASKYPTFPSGFLRLFPENILDYTYLFEIIYPSNRIVVNYENLEDLVLIAVINNETGNEVYFPLIESAAHKFGIPVVKRYDGITDFTKIEQRPNSEGYVIHYPSSGLRFKLKFDEYVRLHKILTGFNTKRVWELLKNGDSIDAFLDRVPDEFYEWFDNTMSNLQANYKSIEEQADYIYNRVRDLPTRKEQALALQTDAAVYRSIVFNMLDKKPYDQIIWKALEPEFEKPFKVEVE